MSLEYMYLMKRHLIYLNSLVAKQYKKDSLKYRTIWIKVLILIIW
jgi:hypothetical protein